MLNEERRVFEGRRIKLEPSSFDWGVSNTCIPHFEIKLKNLGTL